MYEVGKRDLPIATLAILDQIALFFEQKEETEKTHILEKQELEVKALLNDQAKELEYKLIKDQRTLGHIIKKYNKNLQLHALVLHLHLNGASLQCKMNHFTADAYFTFRQRVKPPSGK